MVRLKAVHPMREVAGRLMAHTLVLLAATGAACAGDEATSSVVATATPARAESAPVESATRTPRAPTIAQPSAGAAAGITTTPAASATRTASAGLEASATVPSESGQLATPSLRLVFTLSGGFAGLVQRMTIDGDRARLEDVRRPRTVERTLSASELAELTRLLREADFFAQATEQASPCTDCLEYQLQVTVSSRSHAVHANNLGADPRLRALIDWLARMLSGGLQ